MRFTISFVLFFFCAVTALATAHYDELIEIDDYEYEPEQKKDTCSVHFMWNEGTPTYEMTIVGSACMQSGAATTLTCEDPERALCSGEIEYLACKERYGHKLGSACLDKDDNSIPTNEVIASISIRLFSGAKKMSLTVKTKRYNERIANEAAQIYKLVRKEPK